MWFPVVFAASLGIRVLGERDQKDSILSFHEDSRLYSRASLGQQLSGSLRWTLTLALSLAISYLPH